MRLRAADRQVLGIWLASRAGLAALTVLLGLVGSASTARSPDFVARWDRWDTGLYVKIARWGYFRTGERYPDCCTQAFFPGEPAVLRLAHLVIPSWVGAALAISALAGGVALLALCRLAELDPAGQVPAGRPAAPAGMAAGVRAAVALVLAPYAVFLAAGYSESLFLALALPGWLAARRGHWRAAGVLVGLAATVRITGLFLGVALVVEYLRAGRIPGRSPARDLGWLSLPFATTGAYFAALWAATGDPLDWFSAQRQQWHRGLAWPWDAWTTTYGAITAAGQRGDFAVSFAADAVAVAVGVAVTVILLRRGRYGEAVFVGLNVGVLATSTYYQSVARATLLWFPAWLLLAECAQRRRWIWTGYVWISGPLMLGLVAAFTDGNWVD